MQWVSTFASGASSLGRARRLVGHPAELRPPSSQGKFGENSPHLLGNIEKGKSEKKSLGEVKHSLGLVVTTFPGTKTHAAIILPAKRSQEPSRYAACGARARQPETTKGP